jgi:hypothetical protein
MAMNPLMAWLIGEGIDVGAEKTGLKDRARGILSDLADAVIPPAAASDASAIPQDLIPADVVMTPAQEQQVMQNADRYSGYPYREGGDAVGANVLPIDSARQAQVTQMTPTRLPDMTMQQGPEERRDEVQDFVRMVGGRTQNLMQDVPEEARQNPEVQQGAAALATTEALVSKGMEMPDEPMDLGAPVVGPKDVAQGMYPDGKPQQAEPDFFDKAGSFLTDLFGDEERMTRMALAFNSMRLQPDQGLATVLGKRLETLSAQGKVNKTIEKLKASGNPKYVKIARLMENGLPYKDAIKLVEEGGINAEDEQKLRKELTATEAAQNVAQVSIAFDRIKAVADSPSAAGDLALIFNYMKMLDPGSVVRESEFATAQNAAGVPDRIRNIYNNLLKGERLAPAQREDFIGQAGKLYNSAVSQYQPEYERYTGLAKAYGYEPSRIARQYEPFEMPKVEEKAPVGTPVGTVKTFTTADGNVAKYQKITDGPDTDSTTWKKVD